MSQTPNYNLPTFGQNDVPTWLGSWNDAMLKIDTAIKAASESGGGGSTDEIETKRVKLVPTSGDIGVDIRATNPAILSLTGLNDDLDPHPFVIIRGIDTPSNLSDAANKEYVDVKTSVLQVGSISSSLTYPVISQPSGQYLDGWYNRQGLKFFYDAKWSSGFQVSSDVVLFSTTLATKFTSGGSVPTGVMAMAKLASGTWQPIRLVLTINYSTTKNATTIVFTTVSSTPDIRELMIDSYIPFKKQINA